MYPNRLFVFKSKSIIKVSVLDVEVQKISKFILNMGSNWKIGREIEESVVTSATKNGQDFMYFL